MEFTYVGRNDSYQNAIGGGGSILQEPKIRGNQTTQESMILISVNTASYNGRDTVG